jgi:hypothetical protein
LFVRTAQCLVWDIFDLDHYLVGVDPLEIVLEGSRLGVGQADDSDTKEYGPSFTAGGPENLGFGADEMLLHSECDFIRTNESGDEAVILVTTVVSSVRAQHYHIQTDIRYGLLAFGSLLVVITALSLDGRVHSFIVRRK